MRGQAADLSVEVLDFLGMSGDLVRGTVAALEDRGQRRQGCRFSGADLGGVDAILAR